MLEFPTVRSFHHQDLPGFEGISAHLMSFQEKEEEKSDNSIDVVTASALLNGDSLRCTAYREFQAVAHLKNIPKLSLGIVWKLCSSKSPTFFWPKRYFSLYHCEFAI